MLRKPNMYSLLSLFPAYLVFLVTLSLLSHTSNPLSSDLKILFKCMRRGIFIKRSIFIKRVMAIDHCYLCSLSPSFRSWCERLDVQNNFICVNDCRLGLELKGSSLSGSYCTRDTAGAHVLLGTKMGTKDVKRTTQGPCES